jgi:aryl-alcohol dehydrogenase-like predicted oxidoreductase
LDPGRLLQAVTKTNTDLRRPPDLVLLHNPERSLVQAQQASDVLAAACGVLQEATTKGLCGSWGIASWNPTQLTGLTGPATPRPPVLMVRSGLMVGAETLEAAEALTTTWEPKGVWGMSPFGGDVENPVWDRVDPRIFLREPGEQCTRVQAAFRIAYNLPSVTAVAVGADDPAHLGELLAALPYDVDTETIQRYRAILRSRGRPQPA